jgi:hypothetical protein
MQEQPAIPFSMTTDPYIAAALEHVNRVRALRDMEPISVLPAGRVRTWTDCPIARGCGGVVGGLETCIAPNGKPHVFVHEPAVVEFIERFDRGFYPELDGRLPSDRRSEDAWRGGGSGNIGTLRSMATC